MQIPEIAVDELERRLAQGATLIDVREPDEFVQAHVDGAHLIPLGQVPERHGEIPAEAPEVLVICHLGGRSMRAAEFLVGLGINAVNVSGGTQAWIDSGRPVSQGEAP